MNDAAGWSADDRQLHARVGAHVLAAIARGELPSLSGATPLQVQLHELLMAQRAVADELHTQLAGWFSSACLGGHHLWQDLGLSGRPEVSRLMRLAFPTLFALNTHDLRWKRHLFLCLGQSLGQADLRPPKCDHCGDFDACMGMPAPVAAVTLHGLGRPPIRP